MKRFWWMGLALLVGCGHRGAVKKDLGAYETGYAVGVEDGKKLLRPGISEGEFQGRLASERGSELGKVTKERDDLKRRIEGYLDLKCLCKHKAVLEGK